MYLRLPLFVAIATLTIVGGVTIDHDKVQPFAQPAPATVSEKAAVKFKPSLQIIDGCHPYPAVNAAGETSGGLKHTGPVDGKCKGSGLGSQVYGRSGWYKDLWAIMYSWYFPKDKHLGYKGQRHKWVDAVVWLDNPAFETPKVLAVSTWSWGGGYTSFHTLEMTSTRGTGELQDLIMWEQLSPEARTALSETDFGEAAKVPFIDANFETNLELARP
ncbi:necrosis inducing-like protein NPP1 type [Phytophthora sojae]|uniref:Necrosis inducing-like protein NPP1 type n=1 Tax=Phytophthora sojae (strain P6497) TaxID=1094619 RepID=G5A7Z6_PHYSP|nr:necrosis inducing-like protein NPP1 type [Phytophthora sojae]EGZ08022.1 necrosis inducing-like protein NPP1 type [Phytophthora sojae]|eukprot:XP_009536194.1 necrosis inducing-like protein NPP1 type [Phytophthora sojae]